MYQVVKIKFGVALKNKLINRDQISAIVKFLEQNLEFERYPKTKDKKNRYNNDAHFIYSCLKHSEKLNVEILKAFNEFLSEYCDIESIVEDMSENEDIQKDNVLSMSKYKAK
jgi:hypothetical protein